MKFVLFSEFELGKGMYDKVTGLYDDYASQACFAEEQGFESVWVLEHHFTDLYSYCSAPEILLAALAARTAKVRLGCGVCLLPITIR
jgi:alkanesulfonate monooxygenase SsuD/methylene tetrahydromethanopterin reductase-like flavin-dependent oxidoreductase (luciferase family)